MKKIINGMRGTYLLIIAISTLLSVPVIAQNEIAYSDVDSIGDIWVFSIDKSGSMLKDRTTNPDKPVSVSPAQIAEHVFPWLCDNPDILSLIDYDRDKIAIYETGYGLQKEDSYGTPFDRAASLDYSFVHQVQSLKVFKKNGKKGLKKVLRDRIVCDKREYAYQESFVSQIRVLILSRVVDYVKEQGWNNRFRNIHMVLITDDADMGDQWRLDYFRIKSRSKKKHNELNELNARFFYNSFTQLGNGIIQEREEYTQAGLDTKYHIYLYDYTTLQQQPAPIHVKGDELIAVKPIDGRTIRLKRNSKVWEDECIDFIHIDTIEINGQPFVVNKYLLDTISLVIPCDVHAIQNKVLLRGALQVQYMDNIYGPHMRKIAFTQNSTALTTRSSMWLIITTLTVLCVLIGLLLWILVILPNRQVLTIYSDSKKMRVRRGYRTQWDESINPLSYNCIEHSSGNMFSVFAKHVCYTIQESQYQVNNDTIWFIDSPHPLRHSEQLESFNTSMETHHYIQRHDEYPLVLKQLYLSSPLSSIDALSDSNKKWIRSLSRWLHKLYHRFDPHYFYWITREKATSSIVITSSLLPSSPFLLEIKTSKKFIFGEDDIALSAYYLDITCKPVDVLITQERKTDGSIEWNVYRLASNIRLGQGIGSTKQLIHYSHPAVDATEIINIEQRLRRAIKKELHIASIGMYRLDDSNIPQKLIPFDTELNKCLSYLYLVDDTVEHKSQMIYSPLSDFFNETMSRKMVSIKQSKNDKELYSSLVPFSNAKNMPIDGVCRRESSIKFPAGGALQGELSINDNIVKFLNVTIKIR